MVYNIQQFAYGYTVAVVCQQGEKQYAMEFRVLGPARQLAFLPDGADFV